MSSDLQQMTEDLQTRIRELAYLMWESAGRQQGMAMEYWLKAESEVMSTLQAAARMLPGGRTKSTKAGAEPGRSVSAGATAVESAPVAPPVPPASPSAGKPAAHKVATRGKAKT